MTNAQQFLILIEQVNSQQQYKEYPANDPARPPAAITKMRGRNSSRINEIM